MIFQIWYSYWLLSGPRLSSQKKKLNIHILLKTICPGYRMQTNDCYEMPKSPYFRIWYDQKHWIERCFRVRPRARFCVIFHTKILKNAWKSDVRVFKTHVRKEKRMKILDTRLRFHLLIEISHWCAWYTCNL